MRRSRVPVRGLLAGLLLWMGLVLLAPFALAQDGPDYTAWSRVASRAEESVATGRASDDALEALRAQIVEWRQQFLTAQGPNADRIATLQGQIASLGPAPDTEAGAAPEAEDVAARREELTRQLAELRAPVQAAEEAYSRADGLIREIDTLIRERRTDRLLSLGPSPLNPTRWPEAGAALGGTMSEIWREAGEARRSASVARTLRDRLPVILLLLVGGLFLIVRSRGFVSRIAEVLRNRARRGDPVWAFLLSLGQIVLPLVGVLLVTVAVQTAGLSGGRLGALIGTLPAWAASLLLIWWLGEQVFSGNDAVATIPIDTGRRPEARLHVAILAICMVAHGIVQTFAGLDDYTGDTEFLIEFPLVVIAGVTLFRLGHLLAGLRPDQTDEDVEPMFAHRVVRAIGKATMAVGLVAPLLMAIGYGAAALALVYPTASTLFLLGLITVLQRFIYDLFDMASKGDRAGRGALIPVLAGFAVSLAAIPLLALIWGARVTDLTEVWARFQEGFTVGDSRISPTDFLTFALVFALGYGLTRLLQGALRTSVLPKTRIGAGGQTALLSGIGYVGIFLAALIAITSAGVDLTALGYVAGALSVGIGFGLQNIVSNFVSGIILLIERPISKGDWIEVGGQQGYVRDISVRSTRIETFDRTDVIVPNSDFISGTVTNYTRGNTIGRVIAPVGVAYGTDTRKVEKLLEDIARAHPMVLENPPPAVVFRGFGADSLDFEIRAILRDVNWVLSVHSDMNHEIARVFAEEGIEIPFAQRDVWLRNPETLTRKAPEEPATPKVAPVSPANPPSSAAKGEEPT
ncbi:MAG: mechanosensitive ion channel protein MscS [Pseudooceanicola sp.]|nr:mechanosensitive ion channel protein MscS [Pseudooceanicola sp.]